MKHRNKTLYIVVSLLLLLIASRISIFAAEYQTCATNTTCKIGEYLYDDEYAAITTATCTLTSKDPSGTTFLNDVAMTSNSDGWYEYSFDTTGETEGVYRSELCCTAGTDYLCLDKTFEISSSTSGSTLTAEDVWNSPNRTLTSFGSLAGDVWNYSTRSLSTFGTLVSDIWQHDPTDASVEGDNTTFNAISEEIEANRTLLEKLVNEPIIKSFIEEGEPPDLTEKIDKTRNITNSLYADTQSTKSRLNILLQNWSYLDKNKALSELNIIAKTIGLSTTNPEANSIVDNTNWLETAWGNPITTELANQSHSAVSNTNTAIENIDYYGTSSTSKQYISKMLANIKAIEQAIGDVSNDSSDLTLFGHLRKIQKRAQLLEQNKKEVDYLLTNMSTFSQNNLSQKTNEVEEDILAINEFKGAISVLKSRTQDLKAQIKNKLISLQAILGINKSMLAYNADEAFRSTWLEEGSIIFRSVITNPSKTISQTVPLKYLLPKEIKEEHIIDMDPDLNMNFDTTEDALYVEGEFTLEPEESVVVFVETEDIWVVSEETMKSYKAQAAELLETLEKTSLFGQGATLKSDIDITADKIILAQNQTSTPTSRIRTYREAQLEILGIQEKIEVMKQLVSSSGSASSIMGFIGGSQAILAWGLIGIFITGFAFLTMYMRKLQSPLKKKPVIKPQEQKEKLKIPSLEKRPSLLKSANSKFLPLTMIVIITSTISITILTTIFTRSRKPKVDVIEVVEPSPTVQPTPTPTPTPEKKEDILGDTADNKVQINIEAGGGAVNVRRGAGTNYPIAFTLKGQEEIYIYTQEKDSNGESWANIGFTEEDLNKDWWVLYSLLEETELEE